MTRCASVTATGSATRVFEVTQPRVTCYRVGIRMDDPRMPALLVSHRRPGFYFRVLREGAVQAGDEIVQVPPGPEAMTVAEVDALLYLPGHPRQRRAAGAADPGAARWLEGLVPGRCSARPGASGAGGQRRAGRGRPPPAWPGFRPLAVTAVEPESARWCRSAWPIPAGPPCRPRGRGSS